MSPRPHRLLALCAILMIAATACGGPRLPVNIGVRDFPTDVLLGDAPVQEGEGPRIMPRPADPILVAPPLVRDDGPAPTLPPMPPPVLDCPPADPLQIPVLGAPDLSRTPPVEGTYAFRTEGGAEVAGEWRDFPDEAIREVRPGATHSDGYSFEVTETLGEATTTHRYRAITEWLDPIFGNEIPPGGGLYIEETVRQDPDGDTTVYTWLPPLKVLPFPAFAGAEWEVASTALQGQATIAYQARIGVPMADDRGDPVLDEEGEPLLEPRLRVDACGENLDAWAVQIGYPDEDGNDNPGRLVGPGVALEFTEIAGYATQFGGFPIFETRTASGLSSQGLMNGARTSTINEIPREPGA